MELFLGIKCLQRKLGKGGEWELVPSAYHLIFAHAMGAQGLFLLLTGQIPWPHIIFHLALVYIGAMGISAGAHRLWSHRSYKAKFPLRVILMLMQTLVGQGSIYSWARDHRLHHKYSETDADPHDIRRGIFFAHMGWVMIKEHPEVTEKEKKLDFSDLLADPVVVFQRKYIRILDLVLQQILPIFIPYTFWTHSVYVCVCANYFRWVLSHHGSSLGGSVAHTWTRKPYEKSIGPADITWLSMLLVGEGWHNFHHIFPWDYRSTDVGLYFYNSTTIFIDLMARIGWATELKVVPEHVIRRRAARTGDGSHPTALDREKDNENKNCSSEIGRNFNENVTAIDKLDVGEIGPAPWGWGDGDIPREDISETIIAKCYDQAG